MLMYPIFVTDDPEASVVIQSLPGQRRWGVNRLKEFIGPLVKKGLKSVILFGVPLNCVKVRLNFASNTELGPHASATAPKDSVGSPADDQQGPVILAIKELKRLYPSLYVACDVCLCEYTSHGHCGFLDEHGKINTHPSVKRIADVALAYAKAGADCVAPSDMMDGRVSAIKRRLIDEGYGNKCTLMSYSAKFASSLYGPFRCVLPRSWLTLESNASSQRSRRECPCLRRQEVLPAPTRCKGTCSSSYREPTQPSYFNSGCLDFHRSDGTLMRVLTSSWSNPACPTWTLLPTRPKSPLITLWQSTRSAGNTL